MASLDYRHREIKVFKLRKISTYSVFYSLSISIHVLQCEIGISFGRLSFPIIFSNSSQIKIVKKYYFWLGSSLGLDWNQKLISFYPWKIFEFFSFYFLLVSHHQFYSNYSNFLTFTQNFIFSFSVFLCKIYWLYIKWDFHSNKVTFFKGKFGDRSFL